MGLRWPVLAFPTSPNTPRPTGPWSSVQVPQWTCLSPWPPGPSILGTRAAQKEGLTKAFPSLFLEIGGAADVSVKVQYSC